MFLRSPLSPDDNGSRDVGAWKKRKQDEEAYYSRRLQDTALNSDGSTSGT